MVPEFEIHPDLHALIERINEEISMDEKKFDETMRRYKNKMSDIFKEYGPEIIAGAAVTGALSLYALYAFGVYRGTKLAYHGPCVEVGHKGAQGLLSGKFMILKVVGPDVLYKLVDHEPV